MTDRHGSHEALDPAVDPLRWERAVGAIMAASESELARRGSRAPGALAVLESWARPVLALAASLVVLAAGTVLTAGRNDATQIATAANNTVAEALMPSAVAAWVVTGHSLTADDLVSAIDEL